MEMPTMLERRDVAPDTVLLPSFVPVPGMGVLAVNSFLIHAPEPVLIDTGLGALRRELMAELEAAIDPSALRWLWITHADPDHVGGLAAILERAPELKVVTTFLGMAKMGMLDLLPPERVFLLNPGQRLSIGDRTLLALRPPVFDAPETTCVFDTRTRALFSSDCFGAVLPEPSETAATLTADELRDGMITWATVDAPWLELVSPPALARSLDSIRRLQPSAVLSSHLPPAPGMIDVLLKNLGASCGAPPFVGPDQEALEAAMAAVA